MFSVRRIPFLAAMMIAAAAGGAFAQGPGGPRGGGFGGRGGRGGGGAGGAGRNLLGVVTSVTESKLVYRRMTGRGVAEIEVALDKSVPVSSLKPIKLTDVKEPAWASVRGGAATDSAGNLTAALITVAPKMPEKTSGKTVLGISTGILTVAGETTATLKVGDKSLNLIIDKATLVYAETPARQADLKVGDNVMINPKGADETTGGGGNPAVGIEAIFILPPGDLPAIGGRRGGGPRGGPRGGRGGRGRGGPGGGGPDDGTTGRTVENVA